MSAKALSHIAKAVRLIASSGPRYATFFINTGCNRRCVYCSVPEQGSGVELPPETWHRITDRVVGWGVRLIGILGGEPTLRKDYLQIIEYAAKKAAVNLTSNGDTFVGPGGKERLEALSSAGLSTLTLSLHDLNEVGRQLDILVLARKMGIIPILASVVMKETIGQLPDIMKAANDRGVLYRYSLVQTIGGSFSSNADGLLPTVEQISTFVAAIQKQQEKTHLVQNTNKYIVEGTSAYPRGWHCNSYKDHWVMINNEGKLMACQEYPTKIPVLDIPSLEASVWTTVRSQKREACAGCTYQCYMDEEKLTRWDLTREAFSTAKGLVQSSRHS